MHAHYIYMQKQEKEIDRFSALIFNHTNCPTVVPQNAQLADFPCIRPTNVCVANTTICVETQKLEKPMQAKGGRQI